MSDPVLGKDPRCESMAMSKKGCQYGLRNLFNFKRLWCPGQDSNLHIFKGY